MNVVESAETGTRHLMVNRINDNHGAETLCGQRIEWVWFHEPGALSCRVCLELEAGQLRLFT